jgi:hypothetical protein
MNRKPLPPIQENAWTVGLVIVSAATGIVATIWLAPWAGAAGGFPGVIIPMWIALAIGGKLDQARQRRRDQAVNLPALTADAASESKHPLIQ